jgi:hypothetical protein
MDANCASSDCCIGKTLLDWLPSFASVGAFEDSTFQTTTRHDVGFAKAIPCAGKHDAGVLGVDVEVDEAARLAATQKIDQLIAESVTSVPLAAVPNILLTAKKIGGSTSINPSEGPFWNLEQWALVG